MRFRNCRFIVLGICVLFFFFSAAAQESKIDSLIAAASANSQKNALADYTYEMRLVRRSKWGKNSWLYEAILPSHIPANRIFRHSLILIKQNDRPIPFEFLDSNRRTAIKELEDSERETTTDKPKKDSQEDGGYTTISYKSANDSRKDFQVDLLKLLKICDFSNLKKEDFNGRETFIIEFKPKEDAVLRNGLAYFTKMRGAIWIDEKDKRIIRVEGFPLKTDNEKKAKNNIEKEKINGEKEMVFLYSQILIREGVWFPQKVRLNFINHPELQNGYAYDTEYEFGKYQHLRVETTTSDARP